MPRRKGEHDGPQAPGAFLFDGSWSETAQMRHRGATHQLVRRLCAMRREGRIDPASVAAMVENADEQIAFPNLAQWKTCSTWSSCWESTSAESAVKRCGNLTDVGHWCGEIWKPISISQCSEPRHQGSPRPEEVKRLVATLARVFEESAQRPRQIENSPGDDPRLMED